MKKWMIWALLCATGPLAQGQTLAEVVSSVQERRRVVKQRELLKQYTEDLHNSSARNEVDDLDTKSYGPLEGNMLAVWNVSSAYPTNNNLIGFSLKECVQLLNMASREFDEIKGKYLNVSEKQITRAAAYAMAGQEPAEPFNIGSVRPFTEYDLPSLGLVTPENYREKLQELAINVNSLRVIGWPSVTQMERRTMDGFSTETKTEFTIPSSDGTIMRTQPNSTNVIYKEVTETKPVHPDGEGLDGEHWKYSATTENGEWWHSADIRTGHTEGNSPPVDPPSTPDPDYDQYDAQTPPPPDLQEPAIPNSDFTVRHSIATSLLFQKSVPSDSPAAVNGGGYGDEVVGGRSFVLIKRRFTPVSEEGFSFDDGEGERGDLRFRDHSVRLFTTAPGQILNVHELAGSDGGFLDLPDFPKFTVRGTYVAANGGFALQPSGLSFDEVNGAVGFSGLYAPRDVSPHWVLYQHDLQLLYLPLFKKGLNYTSEAGGVSTGYSSSEIVKKLGKGPSVPVDCTPRSFPDPGVLFSIPLGRGGEGGSSGAIAILNPGLTQYSEEDDLPEEGPHQDATNPDSFDKEGNLHIGNSGPSGLDAGYSTLGANLRFLGSHDEFLVIYERPGESLQRWVLLNGESELATHRDDVSTYKPKYELNTLEWIRAWERPVLRQIVGRNIVVDIIHTPENFETKLIIHHRKSSNGIPAEMLEEEDYGGKIYEFHLNSITEDLSAEGLPSPIFGCSLTEVQDEIEVTRWDFSTPTTESDYEMKEFTATVSRGGETAFKKELKVEVEGYRIEQITTDGNKVVSDLHLTKTGEVGELPEISDILDPDTLVQLASDGVRGPGDDLLTVITYTPNARYPKEITVDTPGIPQQKYQWSVDGPDNDSTGVPFKTTNGLWTTNYSDEGGKLVASYRLAGKEYRRVETRWSAQGSVVKVDDAPRGGLSGGVDDDLWRRSTVRYAMEGEGSDLVPWGLVDIEDESPYGTRVKYESIGAYGGRKVITESGLLENGQVTKGTKNETTINHKGRVRASKSYSLGTLVSGFDGSGENEWGFPTLIDPTYPSSLGNSQVSYHTKRPVQTGSTSSMGVGYSVNARDVLGRVKTFKWNGMDGTNHFNPDGKKGVYSVLEEEAGKLHTSKTTFDRLNRITGSEVTGIHDIEKTFQYGGADGNVTVDTKNSTTSESSTGVFSGATGALATATGNVGLPTGHGIEVDGGLLKKTVTLSNGAEEVVWTDGWGRVIKTETPSAEPGGGVERVEYEYSNPADAISKVIVKEMAQKPRGEQRWTIQAFNPFGNPNDYTASGNSAVSVQGIAMNRDTDLAKNRDRFVLSSTTVGTDNIETIVKKTDQNGDLQERYKSSKNIATWKTTERFNQGEEVVETTVDFSGGAGPNAAGSVITSSSKGWVNVQEFDKLGNLLTGNTSGDGVPHTEQSFERSSKTGQLTGVSSKVGESLSRVDLHGDGRIESFTDPVRGEVIVNHTWENGEETFGFLGRNSVNKFDGTESTYTGIGVDKKVTSTPLAGGGYSTQIEALGENQVTKVTAGNSGLPNAKSYQSGPGTGQTWLSGGRLDTHTLARPELVISVDYTTNGAMEPLRVNYPATEYTDPVSEEFHIGLDGNPETISDQAGEQALTWENDRLTEVDYIGSGVLAGYTVKYTYINGHRTGVNVLRNGQLVHSVGFTRESSGELSGHSGLGMNASYQRDPSNRLPVSTTRNGIIAYTPRNAAINGRLTASYSNVPGAPSFRYTQFDGEGLRKTCQTNRGTWHYQYDGDLQLSSASASPTFQHRLPRFDYHVDAMGRRDEFSSSAGNAMAFALNQPGGQDQSSSLKLRLQAAANAVFYYSDENQTNLMLEVTPAGAGGLYSMTDNGDGTCDLEVNAPELINGGWKKWQIKGVLPLQGDDPPLTHIDAVAITTGVTWISPEAGQFHHDADGNREQAPGWDYIWDGRNRLVAAKTTNYDGSLNGTRLDFKYDSVGRRVEKSVDKKFDGTVTTTTTEFVWDGWDLLYECQRDIGGSILLERKYIWGVDVSGAYGGAGGAGGLLAMEVKEAGGVAQTYYPLYDGTGNLTALVDNAKNIVAEYWYGPFGELIEANGPLAASNPWRFATKYYDQETNLSYFGLRYYDAVTGNWLSREPLGEGESMNLYAYCHGDPVNKVDILGLFPWREGLGDQNGTPYSVYRGLCLDPLAYSADSPESQLARKVNLHVASLANDWHDFTPPSFEASPGMSPLEFYSGYEAHRDRAQNISVLQARFHGHSSVGLAYGIANGHPLSSVHHRGADAFTPFYSAAYATRGVEGVIHMGTAESLVISGTMGVLYSVPGVGAYFVLNGIEAGTMGAGEGAFWLGLEALPFAGGAVRGIGRGLGSLARGRLNPLNYRVPVEMYSGFPRLQYVGTRTSGHQLLPGEGAVGMYDDLIAVGMKGDNITPHHIPSANHMAQHGVSRGDGISINMEHPFPGSGGRHRRTFTYGNSADANLSPRDALGRGVRDARRIYQQDGLYTQEIRRALQDLIRQNRTANPGLFNR